MKIIDCKGLNCPLPVINTKKYFDSIESGEAVIIVDNDVARDNVHKFATGCGYEAVITGENNEFKIAINKKDTTKKEDNTEEFIIVISTNKLGEGDDALGEVLMKGYIYTLSENDKLPSKLIFLNSGVKLAINESQVLESLKKLESNGVEILSCGTCLDFYGVKEQLALGTITNMYTIVEAMNNYGKVIKL